jgi:hypothetical protein
MATLAPGRRRGRLRDPRQRGRGQAVNGYAIPADASPWRAQIEYARAGTVALSDSKII